MTPSDTCRQVEDEARGGIADSGRRGEVRFLGDFAIWPTRVERRTPKLAERYDQLHFCYEAGPTGYGLYRHRRERGHDRRVVAGR